MQGHGDISNMRAKSCLLPILQSCDSKTIFFNIVQYQGSESLHHWMAYQEEMTDTG